MSTLEQWTKKNSTLSANSMSHTIGFLGSVFASAVNYKNKAVSTQHLFKAGIASIQILCSLSDQAAHLSKRPTERSPA